MLDPCPRSPNCVSSLSEDTAHRVEPLASRGDAGEAMAALRGVVEAMPRSRIVTATDTFLRAEFRSMIFRFVDDVEFELDAQAGVVHVRSASRIGHSDLGVNRRRVERIREAFARAIA